MDRTRSLARTMRTLAIAFLFASGAAGAAPLGTRTLSTVDSISEFRPRLANGMVTWQRGSGAASEVMCWDGVSTKRLTNNGVSDQNPETDGVHVVWEASNGIENDIGVYDLLTGVTTILSSPGSQRFPLVSGTYLAWIQMVDADGEVFADGGAEVDWITGNDLVESEFQIDGLHLVWSQGDELMQTPSLDDDQHDIVVWNAEVPGLYILGGMPTDDIHPAIANGVVVWQAGADGSGDIWYGDVLGTASLLYDGADERSPDTDGQSVVWQHWDGADFDIWRVNLASPTAITPVTADELDDVTPQVDGSTIVWVKETTPGDSEIWYVWKGAPATHLPRTRGNGRDDVNPRLDGDHFVYESCANLGQPGELCDIVLVPEPRTTLATAAALAMLAGLAQRSARRAIQLAKRAH